MHKEPETPKSGELVVVLETADLVHLAVVKSLLDSSEIPNWVHGEDPLRMAGSGFFNPNAYCAVLRVRREDLDDVRALLQPVSGDPGAGENE